MFYGLISHLSQQVGFADCSDIVWATCFQEHAECILGKKCEELGQLFAHEPETFDGLIKEACFKNYIVKFRSKLEYYNVSIYFILVFYSFLFFLLVTVFSESDS